MTAPLDTGPDRDLAPQTEGVAATRRAVAVTMVRNEGFLLPRWVEYYGRAVGRQNLVVIDDSSTDGSTDDLPGSVLRLPPYVVGEEGQPDDDSFAGRRARFVSTLTRSLLHYYDTVVVSDVDEFLVPLPERSGSLAEYLATLREPVVAGVGLNLVHNLAAEPAFDPAAAVLAQRRFVKFVPNMCKPLITTVPVEWSGGFHGCSAEYRVDPELLQVHVKFLDFDRAVDNQRVRHRQYTTEGRGGPRSTWRFSADEIEQKAREWMTPSVPPVPLDTRQLPLDDVVRNVRDGTFWASVGGTQQQSMRRGRFLELPESLRDAF